MFRPETRHTWFDRYPVRGILVGMLLVTILLSSWTVVALERHRDALLLVGMLSAVAIISTVTLLILHVAWVRARANLAFVKLYASDILESLSTGVVAFDPDGRLTMISDPARRLLGLSEVRNGDPYSRIFAEYPEIIARLDDLIQREEEFRNQDAVQRSGTAVRQIRVDGCLLTTALGNRIGVIVLLSDVTRLKEVEAEVRHNERLVALGTLAAGVAHEIRNPLSAVDIHLQLLAETIESGRRTEGKMPRYLKVVQGELQRLNAIVEDFIHLGKPRPLAKAPLILETIVDDVLTLIEPECERLHVRVAREGWRKDPAPLTADAAQVRRALLNVMMNALQAMPNGGTLQVTIREGTDRIAVEVRDTGDGVAPADAPRIFDPFFTTRKGGTGLGLSIASKILVDHGGSLRLVPGATGACFALEFPNHVESAAAPVA